jgi:multicomponent Na+:H+ antiporter subunit E
MGQKSHPVHIRDFIYLFFLIALAWLCLTSSLALQELIAGFAVTLVLSVFLVKSYSPIGLPPFGVTRLFAFLSYLGILFYEIAKANIDVAYRIIHPKMPIKPGIVVIKTELKQDLAKLMLANSITLTPGTFTLDIEEDKLLIHWINVSAQDSEKATQIIASKFEKHLKKVFA